MGEQSGYTHPLTGELVEQVPAKTPGKTKPPTIAEVKLYGLLPRVTTLTKVFWKQQLVDYLIDCYLEASEMQSRESGQSVSEWRGSLKDKADEHRFESADKGTAAHLDLQRWLEARCSSPVYSRGIDQFSRFRITSETHRAMANHLLYFMDAVSAVDVQCEARFADVSLGYSGSPDIMIFSASECYVVDIKTTELHYPDGKRKFSTPYDEWQWQLCGAYGKWAERTYDMPVRFIQAIFDRDTGAEYEIKRSSRFGDIHNGLFEYNRMSVNRARRTWECIYDMWCAQNDYDPREFWRDREVPENIFAVDGEEAKSGKEAQF